MDRRPFFIRNAKWQIVLVEIFFLLLYVLITDRLGGVEGNRLWISVDFTLFVIGLLFWPFFFAQFVLPVRTLTDRFLAFFHLYAYLFGFHGPAQRVQEGKVVKRAGEELRKGPGVLLIDAASAVVLRTDVAFTRAVGPGLIFLNLDPRRKAKEYIAGAVDLRVRATTIGPVERENPFNPRGRDETEESYNRRQEHRWETSGMTRDGIEVVPNLNVVFRLEARPGEGGSGFGYNPIAVWRAITGEGVDPGLPTDDARRTVSWEWLPTRLAADVWREYLRMFTMEELFHEAHQNRTGLEIISDMLRQRLTQARVLELNEFGRPTGRYVISPEFALLLRRGLRITTGSVSSVRLPPSVDEVLVRGWESTWLVRARQEREMLDTQRSYARENGQRKALCEYAQAISSFIADGPDEELSGQQLVKKLIEGSRLLSVRDPQLHQRLQAENNDLNDVAGWIQQRPEE